MRSVVVVAGATSKFPAEQAVILEHTVLLTLATDGIAMNSVALHPVMVAQTRVDEAVGAFISYSKSEH